MSQRILLGEESNGFAFGGDSKAGAGPVSADMGARRGFEPIFEGLLEALVCFDGETPTADWDTRDANMAKSIIANLAESTTLVVAGNLHTQIEPITEAAANQT